MRFEEATEMTKRILLATVVIVGLASAASAQEAATIVLRSGERVSGQLIDHGGAGFTMSIGGANRTIPTGEVALVEFGGSGSTALSNDMAARLNNGQHVVVLKNGQAIVGNFYDIGGTTPLRITVDTDSGRREFSSSEVGRIYLAPVGGSAGTAGAQPGAPGSVVVVANQAWTPTGLIVRRGETLTLQTTGEVQLSGDGNDKAHSAGAYNQRRPGAGAPLPQELAGALVARIGNGQAFAIGNNSTVTMPADGQLFLGVNDDALGDNSGQFNVSIQRRSRRR
jgi:hypothetical protein